MARQNNKTVVPAFDRDLVFAAAAAAQRVNGAYLKEATLDEEGNPVVFPNKVLIYDFIHGLREILDEDRELGQRVLLYAQSVMMKSKLADRALSDFELVMYEISQREQIRSKYDISVISSLPASLLRAEERNEAAFRLNQCDSTFIGEVGDKVEVTGEVVRNYYVRDWGTYATVMITSDNKNVSFLLREKMNVGDTISVKGKVKKHLQRDGVFQTQLNYVKLT